MSSSAWAGIVDFDQQTRDTAPLVFMAVAVAAFVVLAVSFGSIAIPLVSILLSVGAAYGLVTPIFRDGRPQGPLGYTSFGGIIAGEPLFMFVFLFGSAWTITCSCCRGSASRVRAARRRGTR
jgi:putative drug exporter of the RND superfamily